MLNEFLTFMGWEYLIGIPCWRVSPTATWTISQFLDNARPHLNTYFHWGTEPDKSMEEAFEVVRFLQRCTEVGL